MTPRQKYLPFVQVLFVSAVLLIFFLVLITPIILLDEGLSLVKWPEVYGILIVLGATMFSTAISAAWIYCELRASEIPKVISVIIFGLACSTIFFLLIVLFIWITKGSSVLGTFDTEGLKNIAPIYLIFAPLFCGIYWGATLNA